MAKLVPFDKLLTWEQHTVRDAMLLGHKNAFLGITNDTLTSNSLVQKSRGIEPSDLSNKLNSDLPDEFSCSARWVDLDSVSDFDLKSIPSGKCCPCLSKEQFEKIEQRLMTKFTERGGTGNLTITRWSNQGDYWAVRARGKQMDVFTRTNDERVGCSFH